MKRKWIILAALAAGSAVLAALGILGSHSDAAWGFATGTGVAAVMSWLAESSAARHQE